MCGPHRRRDAQPARSACPPSCLHACARRTCAAAAHHPPTNGVGSKKEERLGIKCLRFHSINRKAQHLRCFEERCALARCGRRPCLPHQPSPSQRTLRAAPALPAHLLLRGEGVLGRAVGGVQNQVGTAAASRREARGRHGYLSGGGIAGGEGALQQQVAGPGSTTRRGPLSPQRVVWLQAALSPNSHQHSLLLHLRDQPTVACSSRKCRWADAQPGLLARRCRSSWHPSARPAHASGWQPAVSHPSPRARTLHTRVQHGAAPRRLKQDHGGAGAVVCVQEGAAHALHDDRAVQGHLPGGGGQQVGFGVGEGGGVV